MRPFNKILCFCSYSLKTTDLIKSFNSWWLELIENQYHDDICIYNTNLHNNKINYTINYIKVAHNNILHALIELNYVVCVPVPTEGTTGSPISLFVNVKKNQVRVKIEIYLKKQFKVIKEV